MVNGEMSSFSLYLILVLLLPTPNVQVQGQTQSVTFSPIHNQTCPVECPVPPGPSLLKGFRLKIESNVVGKPLFVRRTRSARLRNFSWNILQHSPSQSSRPLCHSRRRKSDKLIIEYYYNFGGRIQSVFIKPLTGSIITTFGDAFSRTYARTYCGKGKEKRKRKI